MAKATSNSKPAVPAAPKQNLPAKTASYADDADQGFEAADKDAYAIPFLTILQSGSPQVKKSDGAYIKGAQEGMIFNTVTREVFAADHADGEGVTVIPCYYTQRFLRWAARDVGGGFRNEYTATDEELKKAKAEGGKDASKFGARFFPDDRGEYNKKTSDILNDTRNHYVLVIGQGGAMTPAVISMSSTQISKSRNWMAAMRSNTGISGDGGRSFILPMFSNSYRLTTRPEKNDKGSWYGWDIERKAAVEATSAEYQAAKALKNAVSAGAIKTATPGLNDESAI